MRERLKNNGLSVALFSLFVLFLAGQTVSGWFHYNEEQSEHGRSAIGLIGYLNTGAFGEAVFENWESEFLQMALYVVLTVFLFQRGSSESKDPDAKDDVDAEPQLKRDLPNVPGPVRRGGLLLAVYSHSLSLAFAFLFFLSFAGHAIFGSRAFNEEAIEHGQKTVSLLEYLGSAQFWFESFQNWQSEFLAIFAIVILSIWLREKGSPESKPVATPHSATGG
jgi:hypothetical protein